MSSAPESLQMVAENLPVNEVNLEFNEILFGLAMLAFVALVVMEKSFVTNTTAFLFNNIILTILKASSLFVVAQKFSSHGLLSDY